MSGLRPGALGRRGQNGTYLVDLERIAIEPGSGTKALIAVQSDTQEVLSGVRRQGGLRAAAARIVGAARYRGEDGSPAGKRSGR